MHLRSTALLLILIPLAIVVSCAASGPSPTIQTAPAPSFKILSAKEPMAVAFLRPRQKLFVR